MMEYRQSLKDCLQPNTNRMTFPDHQEPQVDPTPIQLRELQQDSVIAKEEWDEHTIYDPISVESCASKSKLEQLRSAEVRSPSLQEVPPYKRRKRTVYNQSQMTVLEQFFQANKYPSIHHREELAKLIHIPESRIQVWFQNRRGKDRREKYKSGSVNQIHPPIHHMRVGSTPTPSQQNQPMLARQLRPSSMNLQQATFCRPPTPLPYPSPSCVMTKETMTMNQISSISYYQSPYETNKPQQSCRPMQMPPKVNYMAELGPIPPNKTIPS